MDEFKFVLKCLLFSCLIVIFSQTQISGNTLENKAELFFKHSDTAHWLRAAADGGVKLLREGHYKLQNLVSNGFEKNKTQQFRKTDGFYIDHEANLEDQEHF